MIPDQEDEHININEVDLEFDEILEGEFEHIVIDKELEDKKRDMYKLTRPQGTKWVTVTAIEFNWVFNTKQGKEFLWYLAETTNLDLFTIPVISNIVKF